MSEQYKNYQHKHGVRARQIADENGENVVTEAGVQHAPHGAYVIVYDKPGEFTVDPNDPQKSIPVQGSKILSEEDFETLYEPQTKGESAAAKKAVPPQKKAAARK